jgi:hypothetical protein
MHGWPTAAGTYGTAASTAASTWGTAASAACTTYTAWTDGCAAAVGSTECCVLYTVQAFGALAEPIETKKTES